MNMQSWAQTEGNLCQVKGQRLSEAPYAFKVRVDNKDIQSGLKNQMCFFFIATKASFIRMNKAAVLY